MSRASSNDSAGRGMCDGQTHADEREGQNEEQAGDGEPEAGRAPAERREDAHQPERHHREEHHRQDREEGKRDGAESAVMRLGPKHGSESGEQPDPRTEEDGDGGRPRQRTRSIRREEPAKATTRHAPEERVRQ